MLSRRKIHKSQILRVRFCLVQAVQEYDLHLELESERFAQVTQNRAPLFANMYCERRTAQTIVTTTTCASFGVSFVGTVE